MEAFCHHFDGCRSGDISLTKDGQQKLRVIIDKLESPDEIIAIQLESIKHDVRLNLSRKEFEFLYKNRQKILNYIRQRKETITEKHQIISIKKLKVKMY